MSVVSMKSQHGVSFLKKTGRKGNNPPSVAVGNPSSQAAYKELSSPDLKSVWQTKDVASFFENAEAECKDFTSTRDARLVHMPLKYRSLPIHTDVLCNTLRKPQFCSMADRSPFELAAELLTIPRRPSWHYEMKKEEVDGRERECFNAWKRSLTVVEDTHQQVVSPYERNLEVWRQLWRVVERCDFVFQIVDARNPLRFRSVDLERFISEHTSPLDALPKQCVLLLNKADLLTLHQRDAWAKYLKAMGIPFVFFSALRSWEESLKQSAHEEKQKGADNSSQHLKTSHQKHLEKRKQRRLRGAPHEHVLLGQGKDFPEWVYERANALGINPREVYKQSVAHSGGGESALQKNEESMSTSFSWTSDEQARSERVVKSLCANFSREANFSALNSPAVFDATMLLDLMVGIHRTYLVHETGSDKLPTSEIRQSSDDSGAIGADGSNPPIRPICVGFVGYPNVGKSCTINALIGAKKVTVSSTPGKTKHLQTLHIPGERRVVLCDCPGLVFPTFCLTTEDMVCDGILPIAHMKDFVLPTQLVCNRIPRSVLEAAYNISLDPSEDVDACTSLPDFLLSAIARRRGFMGDHNQPNRSRAARLLLHDFVSGKLIFVHPPPHRTSEPAQTTSDFEHKSSTSSDAGQEWENVSNTDNEEDRERSANIDHPTNCEMAQTPQQLDTSNTTVDGSNGMSSIRFYAPLFLLEAESPEVNRSAQTRRSYEEMFNRNVNASIIRSRNADIERRRNYTRKGKNNHHETDETEESLWELIENGEYALAVEAEDGIVRYEDEVPMIPTTGSGSKTEDGNRNKRQQRRQEKQQLMKKNAHVQHIAQY